MNVKVLAGAFNQEKALVGTFSMIEKTDGLFAALVISVMLCLELLKASALTLQMFNVPDKNNSK